MRRIAACFALLLALVSIASGARAQAPRQVRVRLDAHVTLRTLLEAGLDIVDVHGGDVDLYEWPGDGETLARLGANTRVVDENPGRTAAERARRELASRPRTAPRLVRSAARADGVTRAEVLPPVGEGSLGGFWNLAEIKIKLDDLVASDVNGVVADRLDTLGWSLHHRPIWGLQLGTTVSGPDTRPVAFFNSLTHAREPGGMHALFAFADSLLARYPADPEVKYLLEHRRIYLVPCVNPDGYFYNERIWDSTGTFGMWRKNLRDNNLNGVTGPGDGIDLNRNFGVKWGFNSVGSSGSPGSDTYRGPSAYSEPETQVQRNVVVALKPVSGLSFHTYSDLLVHPWGWTAAGTPDSVKFQTWSDELTRANGYTGGPGPRILYETNGDFNDFVYGDTLLKPKGFTFTPEMGGPGDGFWPSPSRVAAISESAVQTAFVTAGIAGPWVRLERSTLVEGARPAGGTAHVSIRARHIGASGTAGPSLQASLTALDHEVEALTGPVFLPSLASFQSADPIGGATFLVAAADTVTPGRMVRFRVDFTDGQGLHSRDTIEVVVGVPTVVVVHACDAAAGWTFSGAGWGVKANDPLHPSGYLSDSPNGVYANGMNTTATLGATLDLSHGVHAWAFFEDRWGYESDYDGGAVEASLDGVTWAALPGNGSTTSDASNVIGAGVPAFEGTRWRWKQDRVDLSAFAGGALATNVRLRFRSRADAFTQLDGLSIDSLRVLVYDPALQPAPVAVGAAPRVTTLTFSPIGPNPARTHARLSFATAESGPVTLDVLDVQGRNLYTRTERVVAGSEGSRFEWGWNLGDRTGRRVAPGLYLVRLRTRSQEALQRVVVLP
ncbi:MAG: immune inhibitor A [Candidatus Eisenbacteria bacterium]|uniref:Immune inhibitor A n=1 Tax=Eiseniibacteriota bacterium TaxID=2212470 RepID=A0A933W9Z2_UNCEI|nr:immune inhibitor A [Candidatus Eisenbacteria bacterium]